MKASGALVSGPMEEAVPRVVDAARAAVDRNEDDRMSKPLTRKQDDPGVPEALPRTLIRVRDRIGVEVIDRLWIFPPPAADVVSRARCGQHVPAGSGTAKHDHGCLQRGAYG